MSQKVLVKCTYEIEIELPDDMKKDSILFYVEENHCPGTGSIGTKLEEVMEECDSKSICWACRLKGENKVLKINGHELSK